VNRFWDIAPALARDDLVATVDLSADGSTQVWSVADASPILHFTSIAEFGGRRLALCTPPEVAVVVAGAWARHGVGGYDATTGERLWQRKEVKRVQWVTPARTDGGLVAVRPDDGALQILDAATGADVASVRGARHYWQSPFAPIGAAEAYGHVLGIDGTTWSVRWRAPVAGFALLAAAFAPESVVVANTVDGDSGAATSVVCFDLDGHQRWERANPPDTNCPWLAWDEDASQWLAIRFHVNHRVPDTLLRWSEDGEELSSIPLEPRAHEYAFLPGGHRLVTGLGSVLDTTTGAEVGRLLPPTG
jgi:hypothetical protein